MEGRPEPVPSTHLQGFLSKRKVYCVGMELSLGAYASYKWHPAPRIAQASLLKSFSTRTHISLIKSSSTLHSGYSQVL